MRRKIGISMIMDLTPQSLEMKKCNTPKVKKSDTPNPTCFSRITAMRITMRITMTMMLTIRIKMRIDFSS